MHLLMVPNASVVHHQIHMTSPVLSHFTTGHVTMLLGAAKLLKAHEAELKGTVLLVFQPAEEGGAGRV